MNSLFNAFTNMMYFLENHGQLMPYVLVFPTLMPLVAAAIIIIFGQRTIVPRVISIVAVISSFFASIILLNFTLHHGTYAVTVGGWINRGVSGPIGITLVLDTLSALMLVVSSFVLACVLIYAIGQGVRDGREGEPISIFQPSYMILCAGVSNAFLAGDLFNLYVSFEVLLMASFVLLTLGGSDGRIRAGVTYVVVSMVSSAVFVIGIVMIYAATGTVNLADLAVKLSQVPGGTKTALYAILLVGFGIKAAVFPLSTWLPDSYPTAPAPVTAVFAGLLTKVGAYSIIRVHSLLFPEGTLDRTLEIAGLLTMIVGILGAIAQDDIKRILSFTLVSHMGYMFFGISLSTQAGLSAAIFYTIHHILVQTTLFLVVGLIERQAGSTSLRRLGGLGTTFPGLTLVLLIPVLNLGGIPPFTGFIGKVALIQAGVNSGGVLAWILIAGAIVTSLLTLYVVTRVWTLAVWRARKDAPEGNLAASRTKALLDDTGEMEFIDREVDKIPASMLLPTAGLIVVGVFLAIFSQRILSITNASALELTDRSSYIQAVMGP